MVLNKYKNELLAAIGAAGLYTPDFARTETLDTLRLVFKNWVWFQIRVNAQNPDTFAVEYSLFHSGMTVAASSGFVSFPQVLETFKSWLKSQVQRSIEEALVPDLWSQLQQNDQLADTAGATYFSIEEKTQLKLSVEEFRLLIVKTFTPSTDEMKVVNERLDYLKEAVDRLNRFDWRSVAMSTLVSISIALSLDTEKGRMLFGLFQQAFSTVVHLLK